jgi:hypothetical protein
MLRHIRSCQFDRTTSLFPLPLAFTREGGRDLVATNEIPSIVMSSVPKPPVDPGNRMMIINSATEKINKKAVSPICHRILLLSFGDNEVIQL